MASSLSCFKDVLEPRRQEASNFMWISRELKTALAYKQPARPSPVWHKQQVVRSPKIQDIIRKICHEQGATKEQVEQQIQLILDEIGYNKRLTVIRWLGLVLTKICTRVCTGIHVNETIILRLRRTMGDTPVLFLPSHRSYADFILMSYVCFTYDIEIPAIAAGMDFHGMWGMGTVLRDTGAFFMRRSFNNDSLYWDTFRQYVHQLITRGDLPIEFFIEGTRSRSGKSLTPKFGLLSMVLKTFFTAEIPNILLVPINISYDRVLEEKLFAYELLGVPKPKESTSAFFKSLSIIKERYGNIYVNFAEPISAKQFFDPLIDRSVHGIRPLHMQELTSQEKAATSLLAHEILRNQQKLCVVTVFNLMAISLTNFKSNGRLPQLQELIADVLWLKTVLEKFGAITDVKDASRNVTAALDIHRGLMKVNEDSTVDLVKNELVLSDVHVVKLKGHALSQETMTLAVPFVMLQIYVNPVLHYLVNPAFLVVVLKHLGRMNQDSLFGHFSFLRSLFYYEFVTIEKRNYLEFQDSLRLLIDLASIESADDEYYLSNNKRLEEVLCNVLQPFIFAYYITSKVLIQNATDPCKEKFVTMTAQERLELVINKSQTFCHPYCLSLDALGNCLSSLAAAEAIKRSKINGELFCEANNDVLQSVMERLEIYVDQQLIDDDVRYGSTKVCLESKL